MILSHKHRFLYVGLPRAGSTSLHRFFDRPQWEIDPHWAKYQHAAEVPEGCENYLRWTCVRNPYSRLVSLWQFSNVNLELVPHGRAITLPEYLNWISALPDDTPHCFWSWPMTRYLRWVLPVDRVLRLETLAHDIRSLAFVPPDAAVPHVNDFFHTHGGKSYGSMTDHVTPEIEAQIWEMFRADFEVFGYSRYAGLTAPATPRGVSPLASVVQCLADLGEMQHAMARLHGSLAHVLAEMPRE